MFLDRKIATVVTLLLRQVLKSEASIIKLGFVDLLESAVDVIENNRQSPDRTHMHNVRAKTIRVLQ